MAPESAAAATRITTATTYTAPTTTWTISGSPYILEADVTLAPGSILVIDPGVVVKFSGAARQMIVNGALRALGNSTNHIVFTSIQDDSVGGDDGGDGPTTGAAGQWYGIKISAANRLSEFLYSDIRYGGYGSNDANYGAVSVEGIEAWVHLDNATISQSQRSGLRLFYGNARVTSSTISANGTGVYVSEGFLWVGVDSKIRNNTRDGINITLSNSYTGPQSLIRRSDINNNGRHGVSITAQSTPDSSFPSGSFNNIYANADKQLALTWTRLTANWRSNYWGSNVVFAANGSVCLSSGNNSPGKLAYTPLSGGPFSPPNGPISGGAYLGPPSSICGYDDVRILDGEFSTTPYDNSPSSVDYGVGYYVYYYSFGDSLCTAGNEVNPINAVFFGPAGGITNSVNHVETHTGWGGVIEVGEQYFFTGTIGCGATQVERASVQGFGTRFHIRMRETSSVDPILGVTTVGTPHHEDVIVWQPDLPCHAVDKGGGETGLVSGFDQGRNELESKLVYGGHLWYRRFIGNTQTFVQCDGDPAASDGWTDFFYIPEVAH